MTYYNRGYYGDHQSEFGNDDQSVTDSKSDVYDYYHQRQDHPMKQRANRRPMAYKHSSLMDQDFYYQNNASGSSNYGNWAYGHNGSNPKALYVTSSVASAGGDPYSQDYSNERKRGSDQYRKYYDFPVTPEDERSNYMYHNGQSSPSFVSADDMAHQDINECGGYTEPVAATTTEDEDEDDTSFIEDTTTQRNTLINSEPSMPIPTDDYYLDEPDLPQLQTPPVAQVSTDVPSKQAPRQKGKWFKSIVSTALVLKKKAQRLRKEDFGSKLMNQHHHQQQYQSPTSPSIQVISAGNSDLLGDVLDARQQHELITQLNQSPPTPMTSTTTLSPEKTKITSLDRIWVFRLSEPDSNNTENIAWIGFDFENQSKIEAHIKELETKPEDGRLALYDSHIRHKTMPVIVTPNDSKGYYFADIHQTELIMLEVTAIENNHQKVTFVYRV